MEKKNRMSLEEATIKSLYDELPNKEFDDVTGIVDDVLVVTDPNISTEEYDELIERAQELVDETPEGEIPFDEDFIGKYLLTCPICGTTFISDEILQPGATCPICTEIPESFVVKGRLQNEDDVAKDYGIETEEETEESDVDVSEEPEEDEEPEKETMEASEQTKSSTNRLAESKTYTFLKDMLADNNKELVKHNQVLETDTGIENVFNFSEKNGGCVDSHKYYNDYVVIDKRESKKTESKSVKAPKVKQDIEDKINKVMTATGFEEKEVKDYSTVELSDTDDNKVKVEVRAELSFKELSKLADELDKIVTKYDKDSYFDMEQPGIITAYISDSKLVEEKETKTEYIDKGISSDPLEKHSFNSKEELEQYIKEMGYELLNSDVIEPTDTTMEIFELAGSDGEVYVYDLDQEGKVEIKFNAKDSFNLTESVSKKTEEYNPEGFPNAVDIIEFFEKLGKLPDSVEYEGKTYDQVVYGSKSNNVNYVVYADRENEDSYFRLVYSLKQIGQDKYQGLDEILYASDLRE